MTTVRITDTTLRDGSHTIAHSFTAEQVAAVTRALDAAGVPVIEVTHGDGLGGSSFNYGFSSVDDRELILAAAESAKRATIAVLLIPGIGLAADLENAYELGARLTRIATHCTEADIAAQHIRTAVAIGLEANGFLMMAHMIEPTELAEQARLMESYGASCVYVTDSAGALVPDGVRSRVVALRRVLAPETAVGFHAHNNLGLAVGNTIAAIEEGATCVDGSCAGMGAGAGNTATEVLAAALERSGIHTGIDVLSLADAAEHVVLPLVPSPPRTDRASLLLGYAGVYSSFLLHAERAAERFSVDVKDVLMELGERRIVGGQEDMIVAVAAELAKVKA